MQFNGVDHRPMNYGQVKPRPPPFISSDSSLGLGASRPPLVWLFHHIRQEKRTGLLKEDLQKLVGPQVDPVQLNQAFEHLDADGDGEVSLDEFVSGFARFWRETPDTPVPGTDKRYDYTDSPKHTFAVRRGRIPSEEHYEYGGDEDKDEDIGEPDEDFQRSLTVLSSHNRYAIITIKFLEILNGMSATTVILCALI